MATVLPEEAEDKTVTFSSANAEIATVDTSGKVKGIKAGTVKITAETSNGLKAECTVTVTNPIVAVTGVALNKNTTSIVAGATEKLSATVSPENATDKTVTWSTNNAEVATVNGEGLVTAIKAGTANVVATTKDGNKISTCIVTVTNPVVAVTGVALNKNTTSIVVGSTEQLTATVSPENATDKTVTWSTNNAEVATVSETGLVTAVKAGTANVVATTKDGNKISTCVVTVTDPAPS